MAEVFPRDKVAEAAVRKESQTRMFNVGLYLLAAGVCVLLHHLDGRDYFPPTSFDVALQVRQAVEAERWRVIYHGYGLNDNYYYPRPRPGSVFFNETLCSTESC